MAKYRAKKAGAGTVLAKVIAVIIIIALMAGSAYGLGCAITGKADIRQWGKGKEQTETYELAVLPQKLGCMVLSAAKAKSAPVALTAETVSNQNTCTLTATLEPENAYYSAVSWTATDLDGNASAHIELTQDETNPLTVNVNFDGELFFTEKIVVEVVSVKTITASCNVDYLAFPDSAYASVEGGEQFLSCGETYTLTGAFNYSTTAGTIHNAETVISDYALELTNETISAISSELGIDTGWDYAWGNSGANISLGESPYDMFCDTSVTSKDDFNRAFFKVCNGKTDCLKIRVGVCFVYNGKTYTSVDAYINVGLDGASYAVGLEGVNIGDVLFTD